jgi:hypothetical protein
MMKDQEYKDKLAVFYWQPRVVPETKKQFCVCAWGLLCPTQNCFLNQEYKDKLAVFY